MRVTVSRTSESTRLHRRRNRFSKASRYAILAIISATTLYPLYVMINASLRSDTENATNPAGVAMPPLASSFQELVQRGGLLAFGNSVLVSVIASAGAVFLCALAGYSLTKLRFRGRNMIFVALLATMMVPVQTAIPGFFSFFAKFGWINSYQVQILPFITPVFGLFMIRQYLLSVPDSLVEAGRLDGAGEFRIFWELIVPVIRPILSAFGVLQFLAMWNSFIWPQVMASAANVAPLSIVLPTLTDPVLGIQPLFGAMMAGSVLMTIPMIVVFFMNQDAFMRGVSYGSK